MSGDKLTFSCPSCRKGLRAAADQAGKRTRCPRCNDKFRIPVPGAPGPEPDPAGPGEGVRIPDPESLPKRPTRLHRDSSADRGTRPSRGERAGRRSRHAGAECSESPADRQRDRDFPYVWWHWLICALASAGLAAFLAAGRVQKPDDDLFKIVVKIGGKWGAFGFCIFVTVVFSTVSIVLYVRRSGKPRSAGHGRSVKKE